MYSELKEYNASEFVIMRVSCSCCVHLSECPRRSWSGGRVRRERLANESLSFKRCFSPLLAWEFGV